MAALDANGGASALNRVGSICHSRIGAYAFGFVKPLPTGCMNVSTFGRQYKPGASRSIFIDAYNGIIV